MVRDRGNRRAFTLIELLVVISIIALLVAILMPSLAKARELSRRSACKANMSAIGKAIAMYLTSNSDDWMFVQYASFLGKTGAARTTPPATVSPGPNYNTTALLYMLVRNGQIPGIFVCPSTSDTVDPNARSNDTRNWDFSPYAIGKSEHVSYSYQAPMYSSGAGTFSSGVQNSPNPLLVVLADRTPDYAAGTVGGTTRTAAFNWINPGTADLRAGMSANHTEGEMINLLYADTHVGDASRADVGINRDNIYSCSGGAVTQQGAGFTKLPGMVQHQSFSDSFLVGPDKQP